MFQRGWNHQPEQIVGGERCLPWELGTAVLDRHLHQPWSRRWWKGRMARRHPMLGFPGRYPEWTKKGNVTRIWQEAYLWNPLKQFICRFFPFFLFLGFSAGSKAWHWSHSVSPRSMLQLTLSHRPFFRRCMTTFSESFPGISRVYNDNLQRSCNVVFLFLDDSISWEYNDNHNVVII